jgi:transposase
MELCNILTSRQLERLNSIRLVLDGKITLKEAAELMGISYRHAKRLKKSIGAFGPRAMLHGNLGRKSKKAFAEETRKKILQYAQTLYADLNETQLAEKLVVEQHIETSRESVRKILRKEGFMSKNDGKRLRRMSPCAHNGREGEMLLWGGLTGAWFGDKHPECCLMAAMDLATLKCLAAFFCPKEISSEYLRLLKKIILRHGIPANFYQHSQKAARRDTAIWTLQEELLGIQHINQVSRALAQMGIPHNNEKKRRFNRILNTLQNELLHEIALTDIACMAEGNMFLERQFIFDFNHRHAYALTDCKPAWRKVPEQMDIDRICSFRYDAVVDNTNTVTVNEIAIKIHPGPDRISYAQAPVTVHRFLNGLWCVYYNDKKIATHGGACFQELQQELRMHRQSHDTGPVAAQWIYQMYTVCTHQSGADLNEFLARR